MKLRLISCLFASLTGCDTLHGALRSAPLSTSLDSACVEFVVRHVPGVQEVRFAAATDQKNNGKSDGAYTLIYSGDSPKIWGSLRVAQEGTKGLVFSQSHLSFAPVDGEVLNATRHVMRRIELEIAERCGAPKLPATVQEVCYRAECPTIHCPDNCRISP